MLLRKRVLAGLILAGVLLLQGSDLMAGDHKKKDKEEAPVANTKKGKASEAKKGKASAAVKGKVSEPAKGKASVSAPAPKAQPKKHFWSNWFHRNKGKQAAQQKNGAKNVKASNGAAAKNERSGKHSGTKGRVHHNKHHGKHHNKHHGKHHGKSHKARTNENNAKEDVK